MLERTQDFVEREFLSDPAIPALGIVSDPQELSRYLRPILCVPTAALRELQVRLLRHHAGKRCVVEINGRTGDSSFSWIGKVYASDHSHVFRLMQEIRRAGFGPEEDFSIAEPIAYLPELQLLLQEKIPGRPATEFFLSESEAERMAAAERCAHWLARFHGLALRVGSTAKPSSQLSAVERWNRRIAAAGEPLASKAATIFRRLEAFEPDLHSREFGTIHGDFTHHQLLFFEGRTITVDWDDYQMAELNLDVARFVVGLQRLAHRRLGSIRALDPVAEVFLNTYLALTGVDPGSHLNFQRALICLEHAKHDVHKQAPRWRDKAEATLDEALRVTLQESEG